MNVAQRRAGRGWGTITAIVGVAMALTGCGPSAEKVGALGLLSAIGCLLFLLGATALLEHQLGQERRLRAADVGWLLGNLLTGAACLAGALASDVLEIAPEMRLMLGGGATLGALVVGAQIVALKQSARSIGDRVQFVLGFTLVGMILAICVGLYVLDLSSAELEATILMVTLCASASTGFLGLVVWALYQSERHPRPTGVAPLVSVGAMVIAPASAMLLYPGFDEDLAQAIGVFVWLVPGIYGVTPLLLFGLLLYWARTKRRQRRFGVGQGDGHSVAEVFS